MVGPKQSAVLMVMGIVLAFLLSGCSKPVEDVASVELGRETITAGNRFRLSPVKADAITLSGKEFSNTNFVFHCTLLSKETDIDYRGAVTFQSSNSSGSIVTETQSAENFEKWPSGVTQKDVTITFHLLPTFTTYSGHGFLYIYLTNKEKRCISNIVKWKVKFI